MEKKGKVIILLTCGSILQERVKPDENAMLYILWLKNTCYFYTLFSVPGNLMLDINLNGDQNILECVHIRIKSHTDLSIDYKGFNLCQLKQVLH